MERAQISRRRIEVGMSFVLGRRDGCDDVFVFRRKKMKGPEHGSFGFNKELVGRKMSRAPREDFAREGGPTMRYREPAACR